MGSGNQNQKPYLQGQRRMTVDAQTGSPMITDGAVGATESGSTQQITLSNSGGQCANYESAEASPMGLFCYIEPTGPGQTNNLFTVKPVGIANGSGQMAPVGGLVPVGRLTFGHMGVSRTLTFNVAPGSMFRPLFLGSSARFGFNVAPKYFPFADVGGLRKYFAGDPANLSELTNEMWNAQSGSSLVGLTFQQLSVNNVAYAGLSAALDPNLRAVGLAHFGQGAGASSLQDRAHRIFYGTLKPGTAYATRTRCPIAYNATSVMLIGGSQSGVVNYGVEMIQLPDPLTVVPATFGDLAMGAQPSNTFLPLSATGWIEVTSPVDTSALTKEIPFEIHYYLGI